MVKSGSWTSMIPGQREAISGGDLILSRESWDDVNVASWGLKEGNDAP